MQSMFFPALVIDNGSAYTKAGLSSDSLIKPFTIFPTVIAKLKDEYSISRTNARLGQKVSSVLPLQTYDIIRPVKNGIVTGSWDDMVKIWNHTFDRLDVDPSEHPIILSEAAFNPLSNSQRTAEIFFQSFEAPSLHLANQASLSIYASARTTGLVVDIGEDTTTVTPIVDGYRISPNAVQQSHFGGRHLTDYMIRLLKVLGFDLSDPADRKIARQVKEALSYIAQNFEAQISEAKPCQYELPDGAKIFYDTEGFRCAEGLFNSQSAGYYDRPGIHQMITRSIQKCDMDIQNQIKSNIFLVGGSSKIQGIEARLRKEVKLSDINIPDHNENLNVNQFYDRMFSACLGGQILSRLSSFDQMLIKKDEYQEFGDSIVHRKCL